MLSPGDKCIIYRGTGRYTENIGKLVVVTGGRLPFFEGCFTGKGLDITIQTLSSKIMLIKESPAFSIKEIAYFVECPYCSDWLRKLTNLENPAEELELLEPPKEKVYVKR